MSIKKPAPKSGLRKKAEEKLKRKKPIESEQIDQSPIEVKKLIHELQVHEVELAMQNEELLRAEADLEQSRRRYADLFNFAPVGYCIIDPEGVIQEANYTMAEMCGRTKGYLIGKPFSSFVQHPDREIFLDHLRKAFSSDRRSACTVRIRKKNSEPFWVNVDSKRSGGGDAPEPGCLTTMTDVTRIKELEKESGEYVRDLESFTYAASHELRGPLIAIAGFSRILTMDYPQCLDEKQEHMLTSISDNAKRMERLLSDLREFSRVSAKQIDRWPVDMESLFRSAYGDVAPDNKERRITFTVGKLPPAQGDMAMIRRVLVNLLSNAVKFTEHRKDAVIEVQGQKGEGKNLYSVKDNGAGFDMQYAGKLFSVFQRLHSNEEFPGTGAGLCIARRVIEKHGGRIWAEGKQDQGATFYFTLPA